jgi:hypothetical protein
VSSNLPAPTTGNGVGPHGGESYTHGAWQQHIGVMRACLAAFPQALDKMLAALRAEEVGRRQAEGVIAYADHAGAVAGVIGEIITTVDGKVMPIVDTTAAAGGPQDVNDRRYYREM